jgi:hypothetical protein
VEDRLTAILKALKAALPALPVEITHVLNEPLTLPEVEKSIYKLKNNKACGLDGIPAECLKNKTVIELLYRIYSFCFDKGVVPDSWLKGIINPIFKQGSIYEPLNYRGITLINTVGKCYSFILNTMLCKWIEENQILCDEQNGFRHARSCLDHMYVLYTIIKNRILLKRNTFACFIDAKKAFDRVNHSCLWLKLYNCGIQGKMLSAIQSLYDKRYLQCRVRLNNYLTESFAISGGVKQGDPMSPTLFALYINDLIDGLNAVNKGVRCGDKTVSALFYADDIVVLAENAVDLQAQLNIVNEWCSKWRMELNESKTKIMHFRPKSTNASKVEFKCGNVKLEMATKYKYLGLYFNEHMDENDIVKDVAKSATRALGAVICKFKYTGGIHYETFTKLYESCVQPVMLYGAGLWGNREYAKLNTIQNRACKYFLGLPKTASNVACHGDMGWLSVHAKQKVEMVRLWCRLKNMDQTRLTSCIFKWSLSMSNRNIKTWEFFVKQNLRVADMKECVYENELDSKHVVDKFRQFENECDKANWSYKVWDDRKNNVNGNKLRLYRCFKTDIFAETYVVTIMPFIYRQCIAKLRCGSLPLEIELGRRNGTPLEDRQCKMCAVNRVESEIHLLLECQLYDDLREDLLAKLSEDDRNLPVKEQYCSLLSNDDLQADIGKCVFKMMKRRKLFM